MFISYYNMHTGKAMWQGEAQLQQPLIPSLDELLAKSGARTHAFLKTDTGFEALAILGPLAFLVVGSLAKPKRKSISIRDAQRTYNSVCTAGELVSH